MRVLLAVCEPNLSSILRKHMANNGFDVIDQEVHHRKYLNEIIDYEAPSILVLHDYYLESDFENEQERNAELLNFIDQWRLKEESLRVVFLCEREKTDPFLGALVARNVFDIFNNRAIPTELFIKQLIEPPRYSNVTKFGMSDLNLMEVIPPSEESEPEQGRVAAGDDTSEEITGETTEPAAKGEDNLTPKEEVKQKKIREKRTFSAKKTKSEVLDVLDDEDFIQEIPIKEKTIIQHKIVGSIVIGIAGLERNTGTTHLSLMLACFLKKKGLEVAVIEANRANDFFAIEYAYEGGRGYSSEESVFSIKGIDHFKSIQELNIPKIMNEYDFIILDLGEREKSHYFEEFFRTHIQIITAHGNEWKRNQITHFKKLYNKENQDNWLFAIPYISENMLMEIKKEHFENSFRIPYQPDPYELEESTEIVFEEVFSEYLPQKLPASNISNKLMYVGVSLTIVMSIMIALLLFK